MKYYAVIDTNVLVSALLKYQSVPGSVLEFAMEGTIIPLLNADIVAEYRAVMLRPKFGLTEDIVSAVIASLEEAGIYIDADPQEIDLPDPKDLVFYEVVMEKRKLAEAFLVTGNIKHFPKEPFIVTPREIIDIILNGLTEQ